ncbi:MAG: carboxypeptidase-like regulatory domain-containing protein, partial [bacterium]
MSKNIPRLMTATAYVVVVLIFCGASAAQESSRGDEKSNQSRTGQISGKVVDESGQPLVNARVLIRPFGGGQPRMTSSKDEGDFEVKGLDPTAYFLSASLPAYTTPPRDPDSTQPADFRVGDFVNLQLIKGGVITGSVTTAIGDSVVGVIVHAYMIRDANKRLPRYSSFLNERTTDDRGIYRLYGLPSGTYVVAAGGSGNSPDRLNPYESDIPTFAPASSRDGASEVIVRAGEEATNVDIRYRGEPGHSVSGLALGPGGTTPSWFSISLSGVFAGEPQSGITIYQSPGTRFSFTGVADGDYDLTAQSSVQMDEWIVSDPVRIKVRGSDVSGIVLTVKALGSIKGHMALEESAALECKGKRRPVFGEAIVTPWHDEKSAPQDQPQFGWSLGGPTRPDNQGDFTLRNLAPGKYRFHVRTSAKYWYLKSISISVPRASTPSASGSSAIDAARNWTVIKNGDRLSGLSITLAAGGASLHGQISLAMGEKLVPRTFVYLLPADKEQFEDVLRYFAYQVNA